MKQAGGQWSAAELAGYRVKERAPIQFDYRGWKITTAPPPSSGGIALAAMLQILEGWDLNMLDDVHRTHLVVESMRRAYRDRTFFLGDPDFVDVPQRVLTSKDYAQGLRATINPDKATPAICCRVTPRRWKTTRPRTFPSSMAKATALAPPRP